MPYKFKRNCPVCGKPDLLYLGDHLYQVHQLQAHERKQWLSAATFSGFNRAVGVIQGNLHHPQELPKKRIYKIQEFDNKSPSAPRKRSTSVKETPTPVSTVKRPKLTHGVTLTTEAYPEFMFRHKFSLLVVGPTQCGKTFFVEQILTKDLILYETEKPRRILWFYSQWQDRYEAMKSAIGKDIKFFRGLPKFKDDLREIDPKCNNVLIFDDLMSEAIQSPIVSRLFTQGRHRNASVILLLQNMFPKGKFNTDISRNAQYMALFRSPSDRKQIGIIAERMFDKNRQRFMSAYYQETDKPYGYLFVDNRPDTPGNKQVLSDIFGLCRVYPSINKSMKSADEKVETINTQAATLCEAKRPLHSPRPKTFDLVWSETTWPAVKNFMQDASFLKALPEGYGVAVMYTSARNTFNPYISTVSFAYENYWPVQIKHYSNCKTNFIYIHEDEPSVKAFLEETRASERARDSEA